MGERATLRGGFCTAERAALLGGFCTAERAGPRTGCRRGDLLARASKTIRNHEILRASEAEARVCASVSTVRAPFPERAPGRRPPSGREALHTAVQRNTPDGDSSLPFRE
jgi:hypothetical protein